MDNVRIIVNSGVNISNTTKIDILRNVQFFGDCDTLKFLLDHNYPITNHFAKHCKEEYLPIIVEALNERKENAPLKYILAIRMKNERIIRKLLKEEIGRASCRERV